MPKLVFTVVVNSDDEEVDRGYLDRLGKAFWDITELHSWGYTDDEHNPAFYDIT